MLKSILFVTLVLGCVSAVYFETPSVFPNLPFTEYSRGGSNIHETEEFKNSDVYMSASYTRDLQSYTQRTEFIIAETAKCFSEAGWPELTTYNSLVVDTTVENAGQGGDNTLTVVKDATKTLFANFATCMGQDLGTNYVADEHAELHPECQKLSNFPSDHYFEYVEAFTECYNGCLTQYGGQHYWYSFNNGIHNVANAAPEDSASIDFAIFEECLTGKDDSALPLEEKADTVDGKITFTPGAFSWYAYRINETDEQVRYADWQDCGVVCAQTYQARTTENQRHLDEMWSSRYESCMNGNTDDISDISNDFGETQKLEFDELELDYRYPLGCQIYNHLKAGAEGIRLLYQFDQKYWESKQTCSNLCLEVLDFRPNESYEEKMNCQNTCDNTFATASGYDGEADAYFEISEPTEVVVEDDGENASILTAALAILSFVLLTLV